MKRNQSTSKTLTKQTVPKKKTSINNSDSIPLFSEYKLYLNQQVELAITRREKALSLMNSNNN